MSNATGRILIVEDDRPFARSLEHRLKAEGYEVSLADDGREGMRAIVTFEPQLVISDWMMPHVDGLELCRAIKTGLGDEAPFFILLTAREDLSGRSLALETGADDYIVKPCEPGEFILRVRNGMRLVELRTELRRLSAELEALRAGIDGTPRDLARMPETLTLCRPCAKVQLAEGVWEDLAHFVEDMGLVSFEPGTCPDCLDQVADSTRRRRPRVA